MENNEKKQDEMIKDSGGDFTVFATGLSIQTLISLGEMANPATSKKEKNLPQAKYMIDTLAMIKEKTKGNLSPDESRFLDETLYTLRMKYIELSREGVKE